MVKLENEAERLIAQLVALLGRHIVDTAALQIDAALVGTVQGAQQVQQRAFAGAGRADDAEELAVFDGEVQPAQDRNDDRIFAVGFVQIDRG